MGLWHLEPFPKSGAAGAAETLRGPAAGPPSLPSVVAPTCAPDLRGPPFLQGDPHSFPRALKGKSFSPNPGAPPMAKRSDLCIVKLKTENPLCSSTPPFLYTPTYPIFISLPSGFFSTEEPRVGAEGGQEDPSKLGGPALRWGRIRRRLYL